MKKLRKLLIMISMFVLVFFLQKLDAEAITMKWIDDTFSWETHTSVRDTTKIRWRPTHWEVSVTLNGTQKTVTLPINDYIAQGIIQEEIVEQSVSNPWGTTFGDKIWSYHIDTTWKYTISQESIAALFGLKKEALNETDFKVTFNAITEAYEVSASNAELTVGYIASTQNKTLVEAARISHKNAEAGRTLAGGLGRSGWWTNASTVKDVAGYSWGGAPGYYEYWDIVAVKEWVKTSPSYKLTINPNGGTYITSSGAKSTSTLTTTILASHTYYAVSSKSTTSGLTSPTSDKGIRSGYYISQPTKTGYNFAGWHNGTTIIGSFSFSCGAMYGASNPKKDVTVTAQWTAKTYTVKQPFGLFFKPFKFVIINLCQNNYS